MAHVDWELKIWPEPFDKIVFGEKTYEVREDLGDNLQVGDRVKLRRYHPDLEAFTGSEVIVKVTNVTRSDPPSPLPEGIVVFGVDVCTFKLCPDWPS